MRQEPQFVAIRRRPMPIRDPDKFTFRPDRPHRWLQRACLWVLRKLQCHANTIGVQVDRIVIPPRDELFETFIEQYRALSDELLRAERVYVGEDEFMALIGQRGPYDHSFKVEMTFSPDGRRGRILEVPLHVIPTMRGLIVVPRTH